MKLDMLNVSALWAAVTGTVGAVLWMLSTFASASDLLELQVDILYGQYYDRLDDYDESLAEGNEALAAEYARQLEKLKAKICEEDPEWERCDNGRNDQ